MRRDRIIAGSLILTGAVLCLAHVAPAGDAASRKSDAPTLTSAAATSQPHREEELEKEVEELKQELLAVRRLNVQLTRREMERLKLIAELRRQLSQRAVLRIQPHDPSRAVQPPAPKGAIRRDFNGEPFYLIPLE